MNVFPLTIAIHEAFCNRQKERKELANCILSGEHVWIQAIRRHGKTSLVMQALEDMSGSGHPRVVFDRVDLMMAADIEAASGQILKVIGRLAGAIPDKNIASVWQQISGIFQRLKPEVKLTTEGSSIAFGLKAGPEEITESLLCLDALAQKYNVRVALAIDEFQRLGEIDDTYAYEAGIRHAAERVKAVTLIFLGSNRRLMEQAFTKKERPLYRHCRRINLQRISAEAYREHIQRASQLRWNQAVPEEAVDAIIRLTKRHPYYLNSLCSKLWRDDVIPDEVIVKDQWQQVVDEARSVHEGELLRLTANQRRLLTALAHEPTSQPTSKEFVARSKVGSGSMGKALRSLMNEDYISRDEAGFLFVVDPAIAQIITALTGDYGG